MKVSCFGVQQVYNETQSLEVDLLLIKLLIKVVLFKESVLIYAEHCNSSFITFKRSTTKSHYLHLPYLLEYKLEERKMSNPEEENHS